MGNVVAVGMLYVRAAKVVLTQKRETPEATWTQKKNKKIRKKERREKNRRRKPRPPDYFPSPPHTHTRATTFFSLLDVKVYIKSLYCDRKDAQYTDIPRVATTATRPIRRSDTSFHAPVGRVRYVFYNNVIHRGMTTRML